MLSRLRALVDFLQDQKDSALPAAWDRAIEERQEAVREAMKRLGD